jgi:succinyl-diaminopimelate desuccinylase
LLDSLILLERLMKIDSSTLDKSNSAIEISAEYLEKNGIPGKIIDNNGFKSYVAIIGEGEKTLVLNGHLDVVSGNQSQFNPVVKEGKLFGRGSADMKAGCVAMMQAMIRLKDETLNSRIMLQLVPDEETGGYHGTKLLVEEGYIGDFAICTEPTNLNISIQSKGIIRLDIEFSGIAAHGSRPWEGENAILKAIENYNRIEKLPIMNIGSVFYKKSTVNLARINGGDIYNRVPATSVIGLDIRYVPHLDPEEIINAIKKVVDGKVRLLTIEYGVDVKPEHPFILQLSDSIRHIIANKKIEMVVQHGGSDARFFTGQGIPAVDFGPVGDYWHGDQEFVEIESVNQLENILVDFAKKF